MLLSALKKLNSQSETNLDGTVNGKAVGKSKD
jgi:hypothetical protein